MLIYISGPIMIGDQFTNLSNAIAAGEMIASTGHDVVIPHLNCIWHLIFPHEYEFWMEQDLALLARCDAIFRIEGESAGAECEIEFAEEHGIRRVTLADLGIGVRKADG